MNIRDRVLARRDLDELRAARDITRLAERLNEECQPTQLPHQVTAVDILMYSEYPYLISDLLTRAAAGEDVSASAAELLSDNGVTVYVPGFEPPMVNQFEVGEAVYNPDGSEK